MKQRIDLLDFWRSLSILLMVAYHAAFDLELFGVLPMGFTERPWMLVLRYICAGSFIFISGVCLRFSHDPLRRGFLVFLAGALVSVVATILKMPVAFGVLQLLGISMMLSAFLRDRLPKIPRAAAIIFCVVAFGTSLLITEYVQVSAHWLYPLGFRFDGFYSADYYPLLPWFFLFALGVQCSICFEKFRAKSFPEVLTFPGKYSLLIYLLHQPLIYGGLWLIFHT